MRKKFLIWLLVISVLANGWFFYKWQQQEEIYTTKLLSYFQSTTTNAEQIMGISPVQISEESSYVGLKLQAVSNAFASASNMYHPEMDMPIDEAEFQYLYESHVILERTYLPIVEKLEYANQPLSKEDEKKLLELTSNLYNSGLIGEYEYPTDSDLYMQAVKEFLRLEGALSPEEDLKS